MQLIYIINPGAHCAAVDISNGVCLVPVTWLARPTIVFAGKGHDHLIDIATINVWPSSAPKIVTAVANTIVNVQTAANTPYAGDYIT